MLRRLICLFVLVFTATAVPAHAEALRVSAIEPMQYGYMIDGAGFGSDRHQVVVIQNGRALRRAAVIAVSDDRIIVSSSATGEVDVAVRIGDQTSTPVVYEVGRAPVIAAIAPNADGYTIFGNDLDTDRGRLVVIQNGSMLPPTALGTVSDSRIDVRTHVAGTAMIAVQVGAMRSTAVSYAPGDVPEITAITPMSRGYAITGRNFGYDRRRITIAENGRVLPPGALVAVTDGKIDVRSPTKGAITVMIRVGATLSAPATYRPPTRMPIIAAVAPAPEGYAVIGSGFGTDRRRIAVIENNTSLPARDIVSLADNRIVVRSRPSGFVSVTVRVGRLISQPMLFDAAAARAGGSWHARRRYRHRGGPTVSVIVPDPDGYTIVGRGFGTNPHRVSVIEDGAILPQAAIRTVTNSQIIVHSPSRTARLVAVRIGDATSRTERVPAPLAPPRR